MAEGWDGLLVIVAIAAATYLTRIGGHVVLSRLGALGPRLEAALDAVPAAVMAALVAPLAITSGLAEAIAAAVTFLAALRLPMPATLAVGIAAILVLRASGL